jgi:hypothetical protein
VEQTCRGALEKIRELVLEVLAIFNTKIEIKLPYINKDLVFIPYRMTSPLQTLQAVVNKS